MYQLCVGHVKKRNLFSSLCQNVAQLKINEFAFEKGEFNEKCVCVYLHSSGRPFVTLDLI